MVKRRIRRGRPSALAQARRLAKAATGLHRLLTGRKARRIVRAQVELGAATLHNAVKTTISLAGMASDVAKKARKRAQATSPLALQEPQRSGRSKNVTTNGREPLALTPSDPHGAAFLAKTFSNRSGSRNYRLYVPGAYCGRPLPLIVMLHGCTQSPEDFARGTGMNAAVEKRSCFVAYPGQPASAHVQKCWNWYIDRNQHRNGGEPAIIAGITRAIMRDYRIDRRRVYVAGFSAGGAAAAIMGSAYPDLYAAIGVHSGLACGAAHDLPSAVAALKQGRPGASASPSARPQRIVPAIVFHGEQDSTVHPRNADAVVAQALNGHALGVRTENRQIPGGHTYRRTLRTGSDGRTVIEQWLVHGAGHAWSGGERTGSYTDPRGPDATAEMLRFFLEHPLPASR